MSDRPNDRNSEGAERRSGWHVPDKTGRTSVPEQPEPQSAWRTSSLPRDLSVEPETRGAWHLPKPEDTKYTPEDEIAIPAEESAPPVEQPAEAEESLLPFEVESQSSPPPAAAPAALSDSQRAAAILELMDDDEEDDSFSMSELIALASLADAASGGAVHEETQTDAGARISGATDEFDASDPAAYARRQLEMLQKSAADASASLEAALEATGAGAQTPAEPAPSAGGQVDAAEYARQQLARLQGTGGTAEPAPAQPSPISPALSGGLTADERALAQKFHETEARVRDLRRQLQVGQIDRASFEQSLRQAMVLDDARVYWMLGTESDRWYKYENGQWIPSTPAVLEKEAGGAAAAPVFDGDQTMPTTTITDDAWVPRQVPIQDPEATIPGTGGIFLNADQATTPAQPVDLGATVPGRAYTEVTVPAAPYVPQYDSVAAPVQAPVIPDANLYQRAVERQRQNTARTIAIVAALAAGLIFVIGTILVIGAVLYYNSLADPYRSAIVALANYQPQFQTARILAADGSLIAELTSAQGGARTKIPLSQMSPEIIHAVVSIENERFFEDPGFDVVAIGRAFIQNLSAGGIESGASTITQQLARSLILQDTTVTAQRKLQEIVVAAEIARQYDKNFILELYMNEFFFGNQSYGIEAAAQFYYKHGAADLNLAESALIAGLLQAPARYDPVINREAAFVRMNEVLRQQATVGCLQFQHAPYDSQPFCISQELITSPQIILQKARVETAQYLPRQQRINYPHFVNYIQQRVETDFGTSEMFRRGFEIRTTLIPGLQQVAESALRQQVNNLSTNGINTGAVMVTDPRTGAILSMVGSPNFNDETIAGQVNNVFTWQQPGSSIKPVVYTAALEGIDRNGTRAYYTPATILWDVPVTYEGNPPYSPVNYDRSFHGPTALRYALANSYNIPAVKTYAFIGNDKFRETAERMGLRFLPDATFSLASGLGANEVRLYDMVQVYGTLANNGVRAPLYAITSISTADGQNVALPQTLEASQLQVVQPQIAFLLQNILSDNEARSAAFGANSALNINGYGGQVAAKTGTSNDNRDLWTLGFSRTMVVGVWIGRHDNGATFNTSGLAAAPIWNAVMSAALAGTQPGGFTPPQGIVQQQICVETGTVYDQNNVTPGCRSVRTEYFIANSPPLAASQSFVQTAAVDTWSGLRANQFCPDNRETQTFANIDDASAVAWLQTSSGQSWLQSLGLPTNLSAAPTQECNQNTVNPQIRFTNISEGQQITGQVSIQGIVTAPNFQSFRLEIAPATAPNNWELIGGPFAAQQPGGALLTWDTTTRQNGAYTLRLYAQGTNNGYAYRTVNVGLNNQPTPTPTVPMPTLVFPTFDPNATPIPFNAQALPTVTSGFVPMGSLSTLAPTPTIDIN
ncbi:MAG: penicillin-binding protein [Anaerolineae bacterium]|nr:penicillin-binding protein [Anaerolineae bacterium]NUQ02981.1 penicillin-binding protein [Anaerolineae bacterium]